MNKYASFLVLLSLFVFFSCSSQPSKINSEQIILEKNVTSPNTIQEPVIELTEGQKLALDQKKKAQELEDKKVLLAQEQEKKNTFSALFESGRSFQNNKDYANAIDEFNKAGLLYPENLDLLNAKFWTYWGLEAKDKCKEVALKIKYVLINKPVDPSIYYHAFGDVFGTVGLYNEAIEMYTNQIQINGMFGSYHHRGSAYNAIGDTKNAIKDLTTSIEMSKLVNDPSYIYWEKELKGIYFRKAQEYLNQKDYANALDEFNKVELIYPNDIDLLNGKFWAYWGLDAKDKCNEVALELKNILVDKPVDPTIYYHAYGDVFGTVGLYNEAIKMYTNQIQINGMFGSYHHRGSAYNAIGDKENAKKDLTIAIEMAKQNNDPNYGNWLKELSNIK